MLIHFVTMRHLGHFWLEFSSTKNKKATKSLRLFRLFLRQKPFGRPELFSTGRQMGVSDNGGTPKSSNLIGISIINHPFWVPLFLETPKWWGLTVETFGCTPRKALAAGSTFGASRRFVEVSNFWWSIYNLHLHFFQHWIIYVYIHIYIYTCIYVEPSPPKKG